MLKLNCISKCSGTKLSQSCLSGDLIRLISLIHTPSSTQPYPGLESPNLLNGPPGHCGQKTETPAPWSSLVAMDKAFIEQEQEWCCGRTRHRPGLRGTRSCPRTITYLRAWKGGLAGCKFIWMGRSSFHHRLVVWPVLPQKVLVRNEFGKP